MALAHLLASTTMNPVEGFLFLDNIDDEEVKMKLMGTLPGQHGGFGVERSIGETNRGSVHSSQEL